MLTKEEVLEALREVEDPELHHNIVDLGLVYDTKIEQDGIIVTMTFTTPMCPVGPQIKSNVEITLSNLPGIKWVHVQIVWDPPWSAEKMSEEIRMELGLM